jgi:lipoprotein-anchoring transpeptidase ErfK/SrfK
MRQISAAGLTAAVLFSTGSSARVSAQVHAPNASKRGAQVKTTSALPCGDVLGFQVLLDRQQYSPGVIDGRMGANVKRALSAWQAARQLPLSGEADCETWTALGGDAAVSITTPYTISEDDARGPFTERIPNDLMAQSKLPALEYQSVLEAIAERFHASPALLRELNPGATFAAGSEIRVPAVTAFDSVAKPAADPAAADVVVQVTRETSSLVVTRADGSIAMFAPVTTGSEHDPLPAGDWNVTSVHWRPPFNYNPELFWDAKPGHSKATIKPGPNNPVGVVWIDIDKEHYGLHGTPEPAHVGRTASHGCVRLTNWDAARLAALVKPGTPVLFR